MSLQQRKCYCFSRCFYRFGFFPTTSTAIYLYLFLLPPALFSRSIPLRVEKKRGKTSHPIEIIPETAGEIKVSCYCYTPALLEGNNSFTAFYDDPLFFLLFSTSYTNKIYREETGKKRWLSRQQGRVVVVVALVYIIIALKITISFSWLDCERREKRLYFRPELDARPRTEDVFFFLRGGYFTFSFKDGRISITMATIL